MMSLLRIILGGKGNHVHCEQAGLAKANRTQLAGRQREVLVNVVHNKLIGFIISAVHSIKGPKAIVEKGDYTDDKNTQLPISLHDCQSKHVERTDLHPFVDHPTVASECFEEPFVKFE